MDVAEYRRQVEAELERAARERVSFRELLGEARAQETSREEAAAIAPGDEDDLAAALGLLRDPSADATLIGAALRVVSAGVDDRPDLFDALLEMVLDSARPVAQRRAILSALQQIAIRLIGFPAKRPQYLETMRALVDDPDADLRRRAIGILAREKDEYVQGRLLDGLRKRSRALVPAAKAIQFLGYDVHAEYFPLLRDIVENPPSRAAKIEALRVLAADPSSADLLLEVLRDRDEPPEVRRISAVALQSLAPDEVQRQARRMVLDDDEDDQLRALSLTTLSLFADPATLSDDRELNRRVEQLGAESGSRGVRRASAAYLAKRDA